jgi:glycosyltransferase involved in cell wall biosynthesis
MVEMALDIGRLASASPSTLTSPAPRTSGASAGLVSVIIPAYNEAETIGRTISSVINQTYRDLEVLVVDDGSIDETAVLVERMMRLDSRIKLLRKTNGGLVSARNHGISHSQGEFVAPLDADDIWHPRKIEKQVAAMWAGGDRLGLVYCWSRAINDQDRVISFDIAPSTFRGGVYAALIMRNFLCSGAPLVRKTCVDQVGGYDATLAPRGASCCEDLKFNLDIAERFEWEVVPEFLVGYRIRPGRMSTDCDAMLRSHEIVLDEARHRHPELPAKLFRWARAHQYLEFGLMCLGERDLLTGCRHVLRALINDPNATLGLATSRAVMPLFRAAGFTARSGKKAGAGGAFHAMNRSFLECDTKAILGGASKAFVSRRRLAFIAGLRVAYPSHGLSLGKAGARAQASS